MQIFSLEKLPKNAAKNQKLQALEVEHDNTVQRLQKERAEVVDIG